MNKLEKLRILVSDNSGNFLSSRMSESFVKKNSPELVDYIRESTNFYLDEELIFSKRIMLILAGKTSRLVCKCGTEISPRARAESAGAFRNYCSQVCSGSANKGKKITRSAEQQHEINGKREQTMLKLHGFSYNSQRPEVKLKLIAAKNTTYDYIRYDLLNDKAYLTENYKKLSAVEIGELCCCDYSVVLDYLRKYGVDVGSTHTSTSREQRIIAKFIESLGVSVVLNARIIDGQDIDIYVPEFKVGIEFNGFPFHLEAFTGGKRGRHYHVGKTESSLKSGIRLIHVFPHDLQINEAIIFSIIRNALGKTENRIYARQCVVRKVDKQITKQFFETNHLKGNSTFENAVGLYFCDELVHVVSFGKSRFDDKYQYEIIRSASNVNSSVVGGFSKCLKFYIQNFTLSGDKIMTYADRSISEGHSYLKAGFNFVRKTEAGYHYVERGKGAFLVHSRYKFQKHKLTHMFEYAQNKTEWQIMVASGYDRFWDCGNNMYAMVV